MRIFLGLLWTGVIIGAGVCALFLFFTIAGSNGAPQEAAGAAIAAALVVMIYVVARAIERIATAITGTRI